MRLLPPIIKRLAACLCAFLLTSCLDTREEIWINADASGAARIQIAIPLGAAKLHGGEAGVRKMIEEYMNATPAFSSYALNTATEENRLLIDLSLTFDNAFDLHKATAGEAVEELPPGTAEMMGRSEVEFRGLDLVFIRVTELSKAIPGAMFLPGKQLEGHSVTTVIHLPAAATSHNATSAENGARTLIWTTPLATALKQPVETSFTMPLPIPWFTIALVALLLVILVSALIYYFYRRKTRKSAA